MPKNDISEPTCNSENDNYTILPLFLVAVLGLAIIAIGLKAIGLF